MVQTSGFGLEAFELESMEALKISLEVQNLSHHGQEKIQEVRGAEGFAA